METTKANETSRDKLIRDLYEVAQLANDLAGRLNSGHAASVAEGKLLASLSAEAFANLTVLRVTDKISATR